MKKTIPDYIIDGSIMIESVEAFRSILKEYPGRPELLKKYADLLLVNKRTYVAGLHYDQSADLFLNAGRLFAAWVCRLLQWQLSPPPRDKFLEFHQALGSTPHNGAPVDQFIKNLTSAERMAVFSKFCRMHAPANKTILAAGDRRTHLYFVVSGVLQETSHDVRLEKPKARNEESRILWEADCFGDVYPFSETPPVQYCVHTRTRAELVTISRQELIRVCSRFPGVAEGLRRLWHFRFATISERSILPIQDIRKEKRYRIAASMNVLSATAG
jgi:hypothetical protein